MVAFTSGIVMVKSSAEEEAREERPLLVSHLLKHVKTPAKRVCGYKVDSLLAPLRRLDRSALAILLALSGVDSALPTTPCQVYATVEPGLVQDEEEQQQQQHSLSRTRRCIVSRRTLHELGQEDGEARRRQVWGEDCLEDSVARREAQQGPEGEEEEAEEEGQETARRVGRASGACRVGGASSLDQL